MALDIQSPNNAVLVGGTPVRDSLRVKTVANVLPGRLVMYDTDDGHFQAAGSGTDHGLLGWFELAIPANGSAYDPTVVPTTEDWCSVLSGPGIRVRARLASGENIKRGDLLVAAANGELKKASALAIAAGATAVTSTAANGSSIITGSYGDAGGVIVAVAMETVDATAEAKNIVVKSLI